MPIDIIREYYGDEIAVYFDWMNFFLKWIGVPAIFGIIFRILNMIFFLNPSQSPLNAFFSICMAYWSILFAVNWKRH